jgi:hypothetical protein
MIEVMGAEIEGRVVYLLHMLSGPAVEDMEIL